MFVVIIPGPVMRLMRKLILLALLLGLMLAAGALVIYSGKRFFTARQYLIGLDALAIPAALVAGALLVRLGSRLFKSPMDENARGLLSAVGFKAWVIFFLVCGAFAEGAYLGGTGKFHWTVDPHTFSHEAATDDAPTKGKIYIAPATSPAPKPATTTHS